MIFLGGTSANNNWREAFTVTLIKHGVRVAEIFNPVVKDWNAEAKAREALAKATARVRVYYIGDPQQEGNSLSAFSMVEATNGLHDHPHNSVVVIFDTTGMSGHPLKSMAEAEKLLRERFPRALIFNNPEIAAEATAKMC